MMPSCGHMAACNPHVSRAAASCTHRASRGGCLLHCLPQVVILTGGFPPDIVTGTLGDRMTEEHLCMVQVSVASADGFAFGPIAAYSAIEAARESAAQASNPRGDAAVGRRLSLAFTGARRCQPVHVAWHCCSALSDRLV